jgi:hypothetical protein
VKAKLAEEERLKMDLAWAETLQKESQQQISKARMTQRAEDARFKILHSQLMMSNVLFVD